MADLKRTQFGKVDLDYVLGIGGFDLERLNFHLLSPVHGVKQFQATGERKYLISSG